MSTSEDYEIVATTRSTTTIGQTKYTVETFTYAMGKSETHLLGPRGARYLLRPFLGEDTGLRQVISLASGAPLRVQGNEVRVYQIGDVIEMAPQRVARGIR